MDQLNGKHAWQWVSTALAVTAVMGVLYAFTGCWPTLKNEYNSYTLQALSWQEGRLDLGRDYPWLELAIYEGRYYVSFPPFPSLALLPFAAIFGAATPDHWIALAVTIMGAIYALEIARELRGDRADNLFWALFLTVGTNALFVHLNGWVWFIAQNMAFTLSLMAVFYARRGNVWGSLLCWACAVGCRPMVVLYLPLLLDLIWQAVLRENPDARFWPSVLHRLPQVIPCVLVAGIYMALNFFRFGSVFEFGHNYLPEFTRTATGQFDISYFWPNLQNMLRMPAVAADGKLDFYVTEGFAFYLSSPLYIVFAIAWGNAFRKHTDFSPDPCARWLLPLLVILHMALTLMHRTLGGWQFGSRYFVDMLPFVYWGILELTGKQRRVDGMETVFMVFGMVLNIAGTIAYFA